MSQWRVLLPGDEFDIHVTSKQLDLKCDNGLGDPDHGKDTAEDKRALIISSVQAQEE